MPIDYSRYPPNWLTEIRPRIMKRANNKCEIIGCSLNHGQIIFATRARKGKKQMDWFQSLEELQGQWGVIAIWRKVKVVLTIAHLDHDETNWNVQDDRLMAMCQRHHIQYDAKEKYRRSCQKWESNWKEIKE